MFEIIHAADLHLRPTLPRVRNQTIPEWVEWQLQCLQALMEEGRRRGNCDILVTGDLFHKPTAPIWFVNRVASIMIQYEGRWVIMMGNHDMEDRDPNPLATSYGALDLHALAGSTKIMRLRDWYAENPYGTDDVIEGKWPISADVRDFVIFAKRFIGVHAFLQQPGNHNDFVQDGVSCRTLLTKFEKFDAILVGDHHAHFHYEKDGRIVSNPGCMTVQDVSYKDKELGFHVLSAETPDGPLTLTSVAYPKDPTEIIDDAYVIRQHAREDRLEELAQKMASVESTDDEESLDFDLRVQKLLPTAGLSIHGIKALNGLLAVVR